MEEEGIIWGFRTGVAATNGLGISHLLFADDTIPFVMLIPNNFYISGWF